MNANLATGSAGFQPAVSRISNPLPSETGGTSEYSGGCTVPTRAGRFTLNGSDALEQHLASVCKKVHAGIGRIIPKQRLEGLVLGGGYGRGEGGVLKTPAGDQPYNDLEFYVLVRRLLWLNERRYAKSLHQLAEELSSVAGVELEFKITSVAKLRRSPQNLFYHDLIMGHQWLLGDERLFAGCDHHRDAETIPLSEATRLLMNRCSGLLFARDKLEHERFSSDDADFVGRNIAKTELALGDAVLIAFGKYHWSCRERGQRLSDLATSENLPWLEEVRQHHTGGVEFKLQPHQSSLSRAELQKQFREVSSLALGVFLWLENRRLDYYFRSAADYASSRINKWPDTNGWRNRLANLRVFGPRALLIPRPSRHPRERILNALVLLLWMRTQTSPALTRKVRRELLSSEPTAMIPAYRKRWSRAC
ncbi:MAG: hypothetical protein IH623_32325 [Verrucomicrobia bacterium]|nr:hypothetical protein [Verrucomicrobiota bacterium]